MHPVAGDGEGVVSVKERIALRYLAPLMDATSHMVGKAICEHDLPGGSYTIAVGASVCSQLRKKGLVMHTGKLGGWRITNKGRAALSAPP